MPVLDFIPARKTPIIVVLVCLAAVLWRLHDKQVDEYESKTSFQTKCFQEYGHLYEPCTCSSSRKNSRINEMIDPFASLPPVIPFECPKIKLSLASGRDLSTFICHNDPEFNDIAGHLYNYRAWEPDYTAKVLGTLELYPDATLLDMGSNIGTFALMALAMDRKAVAVDAVYYNLALISASAKMIGKTKDIKIVYNSINDKEGIELYPYLEQEHRDIKQAGRTYLVSKDMLDSKEKDWNLIVAPAVTSVTTRMILKEIEAPTVIIKIDIEGYECKALGELLKMKKKDKYIPYIFMEWVNVNANRDHVCDELEEFIQSFLDSGYEPHTEWLVPVTRDQLPECFNVVWIHKKAHRLPL